MKQILKSLLIIVPVAFVTSFLLGITGDDPPKEKPKKDTTKINIEQMQQKNLNAEQHLKLLDSLIMQIDTLKKKK